MTDGINLTGFNETGEQSGSNDINSHYSDNPAGNNMPNGLGAFGGAQDMSAQGNAGLGQEGSSGSMPISGADESDNMHVGM
jgi:hypothetical protein